MDNVLRLTKTGVHISIMELIKIVHAYNNSEIFFCNYGLKE